MIQGRHPTEIPLDQYQVPTENNLGTIPSHTDTLFDLSTVSLILTFLGKDLPDRKQKQYCKHPSFSPTPNHSLVANEITTSVERNSHSPTSIGNQYRKCKHS